MIGMTPFTALANLKHVRLLAAALEVPKYEFVERL